MPFDELNGYVAISLNFCSRQMLCVAQLKVIPNDTIMRQRKGFSLYMAEKRMIVKILLRAALRRHPRVPHDDMCLRRNTQMQPIRRQRTFVNLQSARCVVGDSSGVGAASF